MTGRVPEPGRRVLVGLGTNVEPRRNLSLALARLQALFGTVELSRIRDTAPVGPMRQRFLNAAAVLPTELPAAELKALFCALEVEFGRDRSHPERGTRDRPLDIDVIAELPAGATEVDASRLPDEPYLRPSALELVHVLGLRCAAPAGAVRDAVALPFGGTEIGLAPVRLERGPRDGLAAVVPRRAALVTGGAVRLGREIALSLARAGYDLALHYHSSEAQAEETAAACRAEGVRCETLRGDFLRPDCIPALMEEAASRLPHLELLVNSASLYEAGSIGQTTPEMLDRQWAVNFKAPLLLMKAFDARVGRGTIVNVLDNKIAFNQFQYAAYLTAKKALAEATRMAALEFAPRIRVNGIAPGVVMPGADRGADYLRWRREAIPAGRLGDPDLLCQGLRSLIGNDFITGQVLFVDGGESAAFTGRSAPVFGRGPPPLADAAD